jgi:hypothetical protein
VGHLFFRQPHPFRDGVGAFLLAQLGAASIAASPSFGFGAKPAVHSAAFSR